MKDRKKVVGKPSCLLFALGRPFAPLYGAMMAVRAKLYKLNLIFKRTELPVPVISVGNITMGGTGKTPMVIYIANLFAKKSVAVISRGYSGKAKGTVNVVSDGKQVLLDVASAGDEPYLMASKLPKVAVLTGKKRVFPGQEAVSRYGAEIIILDDGFQHLALERDLNIALFKVDTFLGNSRIFPGGDLREPLSALKRADVFVLTCVNDKNGKKAEAIKEALDKRYPDISVYLGSFKVKELVDLEGVGYNLSKLRPSKVGALCGLAAPSHFKETLQDCELDPIFFKIYPDHYRYSEKQLVQICEQAVAKGVDALVTTEKDIVKMVGFNLPIPIYALRMEVAMSEEFDRFVLDHIKGIRRLGLS